MSDSISPEEAKAAYNEALQRIKEAERNNATKLELYDLPLTELPPEIGRLKQLMILRVGIVYDSKSLLNDLPPEIWELNNLIELDLCNTNLSVLSSRIKQLWNLERLYLCKNYLSSLPKEIGQLTYLRSLVVSQNNLSTLPREIGQLTQLKTLDLNQNNLDVLPEETWQLTNLVKLYLRQNNLSSLSDKIGQLTNLVELSLSENKLSTLPIEIKQLANLVELYLDENMLNTIPKEIGYLSKLEVLYLSENKLRELPGEIGQLLNLEELTIRCNNLRVLSKGIGQLKNLFELGLRQNNLETLPEEIGLLNNLKWLDLNENKKLLLPPEITDTKEAHVVIDFWQKRIASPMHPLNEAKVVLVGQGGVGKTSLVQRLVFDQHNPKEAQTKGINISEWILSVQRNGKPVEIQLNLWDFGGQEIMHATHQFFLTERTVYLLVLDARQGEQEGRVEYWLSLIRSFAGDSPIVIVINKIDEHYLDLNRRGLQEKYPSIVGFVRTSARDGTGMDELKQQIVEVLSKMDHIDTPFPQSWYDVKTKLEAMQETQNYLSYGDYRKLCEEADITYDFSQRTLIRFLHDLGILLNFQDDDRVRDTNILKPEWVTKGVYALLNAQPLAEAGGVLLRNQLVALLDSQQYPLEVHGFILQIMEKFELAFPFESGDRYLVPDLLPVEQPEFEWHDGEALKFEYHYAVLPNSILHRVMVRQHTRIRWDVLWRTGVILEYDGLQALIRADLEDAKIFISINGSGRRREFLSQLRFTFDSLHESITGVKPTEQVPIPGYAGVVVPYKHLLKLEDRGVREQLFPGTDDFISVRKLLNGVEDPSRRHFHGLTRQDLVKLMREAFNHDELDEFCDELNIPLEDFAGGGLRAKVQDVVEYMERRGRLPELVDAVTEYRPHLFLHDSRRRPGVYR